MHAPRAIGVPACSATSGRRSTLPGPGGKRRYLPVPTRSVDASTLTPGHHEEADSLRVRAAVIRPIEIAGIEGLLKPPAARVSRRCAIGVHEVVAVFVGITVLRKEKCGRAAACGQRANVVLVND